MFSFILLNCSPYVAIINEILCHTVVTYLYQIAAGFDQIDDDFFYYMTEYLDCSFYRPIHREGYLHVHCLRRHII